MNKNVDCATSSFSQGEDDTQLRITLVGPVYPYRGGIAHYTAMLDQAVLERGHISSVISFKRQYPDWLYPGSTDKDPSNKPLCTKAEYLLDPLQPWTWRKAAARIIRNRPDLVVIQWWTTFWALPFAALSWSLKQSGLQVGYIIHNVIPHEQKPWDPWLARVALKQGDFFITQTKQEEERLLALHSSAKIQTCPLPVYSLLSEGKCPKEEARENLRLSQHDPILLFFGIVRPYKGLRVLLEAMALLKNIGKSAKLIIAGEFWEDVSLYKKQIDDLQISGQVIIENRYLPNEDVSLYFSAADVLIAPYVGGTQSAAAGLALGFGLPMIVTDRVAAGLVMENKSSLVVPAGNPEALAQAIAAYLDNPGKYRATPLENDWWRLVQVLEEAICSD